jgi:hypothetical protein
VVSFIRAYRDAVGWLLDPANRAAAQAILQANVPGMTPAIAEQSCALMLDPATGFFRDAGLDARGVQAVLALRGKLAEPPRALGDPEKYLDRKYWREAVGG